jgi:hypothetical protein
MLFSDDASDRIKQLHLTKQPAVFSYQYFIRLTVNMPFCKDASAIYFNLSGFIRPNLGGLQDVGSKKERNETNRPDSRTP